MGGGGEVVVRVHVRYYTDEGRLLADVGQVISVMRCDVRSCKTIPAWHLISAVCGTFLVSKVIRVDVRLSKFLNVHVT